MSNGSIDIFENSSDVRVRGCDFTVAGSQKKTTFERGHSNPHHIDPWPESTFSEQGVTRSPPMPTSPPSPTSGYIDTDRPVTDFNGVSIFRNSRDIRMSNSGITTVKGSQDIVILPNRTRLDTLDEGIRVAGAFPQDPKYDLMAGHNDTELRRSDGFSQSSLDDRMVNGEGCESSFVNTGGLPYCHPAQTAIPPLSHKMTPSHQPQDKKNGSRSPSDNLTLGNLNFFDGSRRAHVSSTVAFRTGTDLGRYHHIHQSQPGSTPSRPVQDPTTLVRDERIAASRQNGSNAKERSVNIFSNSEDASLQDTTFHITDKSKDAIEIPSRPTHEYAELVKAISSARGPSDSSMRGPMVSIDAPGQPPYFATGNMAPGHYPSYASSQGYPDQGTSYSRGGYGSPPLPNRNMSGYNNSWMQHGPSGPGHPSMPSSPPTQYAQAQHGPSGFVPHSMPPSPNYAPTQYAQVQHGPSGFVPHSMPPSPNYAPTQNGYSGYQGGQR